MIIGLTGRKGSGKSEVARLLYERGWLVYPFAYPLKEMLATLLSTRGVEDDKIERMLRGDLKEVAHPALNNRTPRHAMQTLGTEWGRELVHGDLWINAWIDLVRKCDLVVADDVRFVNEAQLIRSMGGQVWRITRDTGDDVVSDQHVSETPLPDALVNTTIQNSRTLKHLRDMVELLAVKVERAVPGVAA
jgi:hypothetical protein